MSEEEKTKIYEAIKIAWKEYQSEEFSNKVYSQILSKFLKNGSDFSKIEKFVSDYFVKEKDIIPD